MSNTPNEKQISKCCGAEKEIKHCKCGICDKPMPYCSKCNEPFEPQEVKVENVAHIYCPICRKTGMQTYEIPANLEDCLKGKWHDCTPTQEVKEWEEHQIQIEAITEKDGMFYLAVKTNALKDDIEVVTQKYIKQLISSAIKERDAEIVEKWIRCGVKCLCCDLVESIITNKNKHENN